MRLLILAAAFSVALAFNCPRQCDCGTGDELEYFCRVNNANVTFTGRRNEYVTIKCSGTNFTCSDLPTINFVNDLPLDSLGVVSCSPAILRCVKPALNTTSVRLVMMRNSSQELTAEDVEALTDLQTFLIYDGPDKKIPVKVIQNLPKLKELRLPGTRVSLQSDEFIRSPPITYLELSMAHINEIPENAFYGLSQLKTLSIWSNNFTEIHVNSLAGLQSLEVLILNNDHLQVLPPGTLTHVPMLKSIAINMNDLKELPAGLIYNLTHLENITIQYNSVPLSLQPAALSKLPSLKRLILESSKIKTLPEDLLTGSDTLQTLSLSHNQISSLPASFFKDMTSLEDLDLSFNKIEVLESAIFAPLKKLRRLNMNRNHLEVLPERLFSGLKNLNYVSMDHNYLKKISLDTFQGAESLQTLSLIGNKLTLKEEGYYNIELYSPFDHLKDLRNLYLNGNDIDTIFPDWTMNLLRLEQLDLSWNKFTFLISTELQFLSDRITVDLRHNNITTIQLADAYQPLLDSQPTNSTILLDNNPLNCDCKLYYLALRLRGAKPLTVEPKFNVGEAKCASPPRLQGELVKKLSLDDFVCEMPECFDTCSSCEYRPAKNDMYYDCFTVPQLKNSIDYGVMSQSLKLGIPPVSLANLSLSFLNLSGIGLTKIPFKPSETVKVIDFSNNNLTRVPVDFLKSNITLYLANNPFECECWYSNDISLLKRSSLVYDLRNVTCRNGGKIDKLDVAALCSTWRALGISGGIFIIALLILVTFTIFTIKRNIVFIKTKGIFPWRAVDDPDDVTKTYDVFISFAHEDGAFLKTLLPLLEENFGLKTCVHYRDWVVGDLIPDQIVRSVESSRRTIILLSKNYLKSQFANMEFRAVYNLALKEGKNRIIIILLEEVTDDERLSDEIKAYMKSNTYLKSDDIKFSERLRRALPLKNNQFNWPRLFKQAAVKTVKGGLDVQLNSNGQLVNMAAKDPA